MTRAVVAVAGFVVAAVMFAGGAFIWAKSEHMRPGPHGERVVLAIEPGTGARRLAEELEAAGVIRHGWLFLAMARLDRVHTAFKAGEYAFEPGLTQALVMRKIIAHDIVTYLVTVPEGLTSGRIVEILRGEPRLSGDIGAIPPNGALLPETYRFARGDRRSDMLRRMNLAMAGLQDELWAARAEDLPFESWEEAVILASIVERETAVGAERPRVAAVFVNRLRKGMRLQSDPTVAYALTDGEGALDRALTRQDWRYEHPYNTYIIPGLPPGPICNPGRAAIEAVLNPAETDELYFVADGEGGHAFARTLEEHNRNVSRWRKLRDSVAE